MVRVRVWGARDPIPDAVRRRRRVEEAIHESRRHYRITACSAQNNRRAQFPELRRRVAISHRSRGDQSRESIERDAVVIVGSVSLEATLLLLPNSTHGMIQKAKDIHFKNTISYMENRIKTDISNIDE